jgi:hypothetical protein
MFHASFSVHSEPRIVDVVVGVKVKKVLADAVAKRRQELPEAGKLLQAPLHSDSAVIFIDWVCPTW